MENKHGLLKIFKRTRINKSIRSSHDAVLWVFFATWFISDDFVLTYLLHESKLMISGPNSHSGLFSSFHKCVVDNYPTQFAHRSSTLIKSLAIPWVRRHFHLVIESRSGKRHERHLGAVDRRGVGHRRLQGGVHRGHGVQLPQGGGAAAKGEGQTIVPLQSVFFLLRSFIGVRKIGNG